MQKPKPGKHLGGAPRAQILLRAKEKKAQAVLRHQRDLAALRPKIIFALTTQKGWNISDLKTNTLRMAHVKTFPGLPGGFTAFLEEIVKKNPKLKSSVRWGPAHPFAQKPVAPPKPTTKERTPEQYAWIYGGMKKVTRK